MKSQLVTLLMFAAPLMLQVMLSDHTPLSAPSSPVSSGETCGQEESPAEKPSTAATKSAPAQPAAAATRAPSAALRPSPVSSPAKSGPRIPAKLAPWLM